MSINQPTEQDWRQLAACRREDPELFYPTGNSGPAYQRQEAAAKAVCRRCPVRQQCLTWAMDHLPHGIAGGLTETERSQGRNPSRERRTSTRPSERVTSSTQAENAAAGRAALRAGRRITEVAAAFKVDERTAYRWAQRVRAEQAHELAETG